LYIFIFHFLYILILSLIYGDYGYNSCYIRPVVVLDSIVTNIDIDLKCSWIGN